MVQINVLFQNSFKIDLDDKITVQNLKKKIIGEHFPTQFKLIKNGLILSENDFIAKNDKIFLKFPYQNPSCFSSTTNNRLSPKESYLFSQLILLISQIDPKNDEMNNKLYVGFFNGSKSFLRNKSFAEHGKTFNQIAISVANYAAKVIILDKMDHRTALFTFIYFKHELKKILDKFEGSLENYLNFKKMATKFVGKWIREISSFYSDGILSVKKRLNVWTEIIDKDVENNCLLDRKTFVESLLRFYRDFCVDLYSKKKKPENRKNFGFYSKFERNLLKI